MQLVLERGSIDKPLTFDVGLIEPSFLSPNVCKGVFNPNVTIFQSNCAEGLHFSAFLLHYYYCGTVLSSISIYFIVIVILYFCPIIIIFNIIIIVLYLLVL